MSTIICGISGKVTLNVIDRYVQGVVEVSKKALLSIRDEYIIRERLSKGSGRNISISVREWETMKKKIADLERKVQNLQPDEQIISQRFQEILSEQTSELFSDNQGKL